MDRLDAMRIFTRIVEQRSFTATAESLGLPRSTVTDAVKRLEARLGVRLLHRTTRHVSPTLEGETYHHRCLTILADIEETEGAFAGAKPRGGLRVDVHGSLARHFLIPALPAFLAEYPDIALFMGEGDRLVDLIREGVDCVLRSGHIADSDMVSRTLIQLPQVTCAAPSYLAVRGTPQSPNQLDGHHMVGFHSSASGAVLPLEFSLGPTVQTLRLPAPMTVNGAESLVECARHGLGIIQVPRYRLEADFQRGILVPILTATPPPPMSVSVLYPKNRQLAPRVRVFIDWLTQRFADTTL